MASAELELLLLNLDQAYDAKAWHGTNLRGSIRGLEVEEIVHRPDPDRHNIWELVVHCAYWKYTVWRRLTGARKGSFAHQGSNFFPRPDGPGTATELRAAWRSDVQLLDRVHAQLRSAVAELPAKKLSFVPRGTKYPNSETILGIAAHDLYHAGQIQLLKRLARAGD
jgi:hypothetical protein